MRAFNCRAAALLACCAVSACGSEEDGDAEPTGRGSAACRDFQDATCDFGSDRCHVVDRATCDAMFRAIECTDDELASGCANALNDAACGVGVPQCDLARIADPAPAIAHCETFVQTFCDHAMSCGTPEADCEQSVAAMGIDCSQAFAIDLRYEECLQAIEALACGARLPTICTGVVLVLPPSASDGAS